MNEENYVTPDFLIRKYMFEKDYSGIKIELNEEWDSRFGKRASYDVSIDDLSTELHVLVGEDGSVECHQGITDIYDTPTVVEDDPLLGSGWVVGSNVVQRNSPKTFSAVVHVRHLEDAKSGKIVSKYKVDTYPTEDSRPTTMDLVFWGNNGRSLASGQNLYLSHVQVKLFEQKEYLSVPEYADVIPIDGSVYNKNSVEDALDDVCTVVEEKFKAQFTDPKEHQMIAEESDRCVGCGKSRDELDAGNVLEPRTGNIPEDDRVVDEWACVHCLQGDNNV